MERASSATGRSRSTPTWSRSRRDPEAFCSGKGILTFEIGVEYPSPPTMMHTDPPDHTRVPQARAARLRADGASARSTTRGARPRRRARGASRPTSVRRGRDPRGAVPALDHRRAPRHPRVRLGTLLPVVGSFDPRRDRLDAGRVRALQAEMHEYLLDDDARAPHRSARRHHLGARATPRSTASRSATTSS